MNKLFNYTFDADLPAMTDAVKTILTDGLVRDCEVGFQHVFIAQQAFDFEGPYGMAKRLGLLVNNSAEDMAIEFMTFVNKIHPCTY